MFTNTSRHGLVYLNICSMNCNFTFRLCFCSSYQCFAWFHSFYSFFFPILYLVSSDHSFFSLKLMTLICDKGAASTALLLTTFTNPQSDKRLAIVFRLAISFSEIFVSLPSRANNSLK